VFRLVIESLDLEAQGVARREGKVVFVRGALPGEVVQARVVRSKASFEVAEVVSIEQASVMRVAPKCPHFSICGGCSMQHLEARAQLAIKQRALEDQLKHLGNVRAQKILRPLAGPAWSYRYRARLSVRHVPKKGGVLVGFHERGSSYVADMTSCEILPPKVSTLLLPLRTLIESLTIRDRLPQIELAVGQAPTDIALVLRVLDTPSAEDRLRLLEFSAQHGVEFWLQPKGPDTVQLLQGQASMLAYHLPEFGVRMPYRPTDFTQVNHAINERLVGKAIGLLGVQSHHRVADLFCGLGNFSLPLARVAREVIGIEGAKSLTERAQANAVLNGVGHKTRFETRNLFTMDLAGWRALGPLDRVLIDPPREGALEVCKALAADSTKVPRIVYVSCNPATLARDAAVLVHTGGYTLLAAGAVNMFPQTSHVESIAVFEPATADQAQAL
jgi:23S rRNA (uracil1939-C5)-methyltransferase